MKTPEFNLSEKIEEPIKFSIGDDYDARSVKLGIQKERARIKEDIKEFIKRFKERTKKKYYCYDCIDETLDYLDKLAGDKLI